MDKKKKRKKRRGRLLDSRFYRVYFAALALALLAVAVGLVWLNGAVGDYEVAQPVHAAEVVARLFEEGDYQSLYAFDTSAAEISDGDEAFYARTLEALAAGKAVSWRESFSADPGVKSYTVALDGDKFATFTLVPSGETTRHGNPLWQLGSVTTHVTLQAPEPTVPPEALNCRVTAPEGYSVEVEGRLLTEADVASTQSLLPEDFLPEGTSAPALVVYAFASQGDAPEIVVTDPNGVEVAPSEAGEDSWSYLPLQDEQLLETYSDDIIKLGERIAKYTAKDLSQSALLAGVASDSPAETVIKKFSNSWAPNHKTSEIVNPAVSQFYVLSDECFTCHVEFDFVLTSRKGNEYVYPTAYTFCVVRRKGEGRLYNLMFH